MIINIAPNIKVIIDKEDKRNIEKHKWYLNPKQSSIITCFTENGKKHSYTLPRFILSEYGHIFGPDEFVSYANKDIFDNRKANFVIRTRSEVLKNRKQIRCVKRKERRLPYGVYATKSGRLQVLRKVKGKLLYYGTYSNVNQAVSRVEEIL